MKKLTFLAAIAALFAAAQARAVTYYADVDLIDTVLTEGASYQSNFNIKNNGGDSLAEILAIVLQSATDGFDPVTEVVTEAWAYFTVLDGDFAQEKVKVKLGGDLFVAPTDFFIVGILGGQVDIAGVMSLNENGKIGYKVTSTKGDFLLVNAGLLAKTKPVPDASSTLALFGAAILGIAGLRRRLKR